MFNVFCDKLELILPVYSRKPSDTTRSESGMKWRDGVGKTLKKMPLHILGYL